MIVGVNPLLLKSGGQPLFLDDYPGATFAYSLHRKLNSAYTGSCIQVRRSSDNTTLDIGFVGNVIDEAAITSFVGAGDGFVPALYDQSGNGNDSVAGIGASHKIVESGVLYKENGFVSLKCTQSAPNYGTNVIPTGNTTALVVGNTTQPGARSAARIFTTYQGSGAVDDEYLFDFVYGSGLRFFSASTSVVQSASPGWSLVYANRSSNTIRVAQNGAAASSASGSSTQPDFDIHISEDAAGTTNDEFPTSLTEMIFYLSDEHSNKSAMESAINDFYSIY